MLADGNNQVSRRQANRYIVLAHVLLDAWGLLLGLIPTTLFQEAGKTNDPSVSVPMLPAARPIDDATALPLELPFGS